MTNETGASSIIKQDIAKTAKTYKGWLGIVAYQHL